jgi:hypothetical protein
VHLHWRAHGHYAWLVSFYAVILHATISNTWCAVKRAVLSNMVGPVHFEQCPCFKLFDPALDSKSFEWDSPVSFAGHILDMVSHRV